MVAPVAALHGAPVSILAQSVDQSAPEFKVPRVDLAGLPDSTRNRVLRLRQHIESLQATSASPEAQAEALGALARIYLAYDYFEAATSCLRHAAQLQPGAQAWPYYLGLAAAAIGDFQQAEAGFRRAVELAPQDVAALLRLADLLAETGDVGSAERFYRRALDLRPNLAAAHAGLGHVAALQDEPEEAIRRLMRALELAPEATALHYQLAQQYRAIGDLESARKHLENRGDRTPLFPDPLAEAVEVERVETAFQVTRELAEGSSSLSVEEVIGFAVAQFGDLQEAIAAFERSVDAENDEAVSATSRARLRFVLGALHAQAGNAEAARYRYEEALGLDPQLWEARTALAWALRRLGEDEQALDELNRVLDARPDDVKARLRRADLYRSLQQIDPALRDLEHALELQPESSEIHLRRAELLAEAGERNEAIIAYRRALELPMQRSDRAVAHRRVAILLTLSNQTAGAIEHYRAALELDPEFHRARLELAAALLRTGETETARNEFRRVRTVRGDDADAYLGESTALILLDRQREAAALLEEGLARLPENPRLLGTLARLLATSSSEGIRNGPRALDLARRLIDLEASPVNRETLAMALAAAGRFDEAEALQAELTRAARRMGDQELAEQLAQALELYRTRRPCCPSRTEVP